MLKENLTPKTTAIVLGSVLLVCLLLGGGYRFMQNRNVQAEEKRMNWQRDREMGIPDLGLRENATEEEKEVAKTQMLEQKLSEQRSAPTYPGY